MFEGGGGGGKGNCKVSVSSDEAHFAAWAFLYYGYDKLYTCVFLFCLADNDSIEELDLSWNNFRLKSGTILCQGIAVSVLGQATARLTVNQLIFSAFHFRILSPMTFSRRLILRGRVNCTMRGQSTVYLNGHVRGDLFSRVFTFLRK